MRVVKIYQEVSTGPLYDGAVQLMQRYRSVAARMRNAKSSTQGKLDRRLELLGEQISERLSELSDMERLALNCWQHGIMPDTYEVDHNAITEKPYTSIRKVERVIENFGPDDAGTEKTSNNGYEGASRLRAFISKLDKGQ